MCRPGLGRCRGSSAARTIAGKKTAHAAEQDRPDVLAAREAWFEAQPDLDPERLVFIDDPKGGEAKLARPLRWPAHADGLRGANGCAPAFHTDTGKRRLS